MLDLKDEVQPQLFALTPVAEFGHRLVLDLYPLTPLDPLMALLEGEAQRRRSAPRCASRQAGGARSAPRRARDRPASAGAATASSIAIDPGHGGEDPGAIGRRGTYEKNVDARDRAQAEAR